MLGEPSRRVDATPRDRYHLVTDGDHRPAEGICGIAIGQDHEAPPLTDAMFAAADRLGFPLLFTRRSC